MLERLKTGLGVAVRTGAIPMLIGARIAERRRATHPEGVPERQGGFAMTSKAVLDDVFFATELAMAPLISPRDRGRLGRELTQAAKVYADNGWDDDPTSYHQDPPPLEVIRFDEFRSRWIPYRHMRFDSGYTPHPDEPGRARWMSYTANRTAHAWILKHPGPQRPWLVCIPGYRMGNPVVDFAGFRAAWLYKTLGLNVAIPVIPLHGPRRVGARGGDGFFSGDFIDTLHAQAQAVWDIRRLVGWLRSHGAPAVGTYGVSLGGYTAALHASLEDDLDCVIVGVPATDFSRLLQTHVPNFVLSAAERLGMSFEPIERALSVVSPFSFSPRVPWDRRFLFAGISDHLTSPDHAHDLWHHWEKPRVAWYQGGHVSFIWQREVRQLIHEALETSGLTRRPAPALAASVA
jgi:dienelactone hydrolase